MARARENNLIPRTEQGKQTKPLTLPVKLVIGLGNPDARYKATYHNAGHNALERLLGEESAHHAAWKTHANNFEYVRKANITWVRPLAYMNDSGAAVKKAMLRFEVPPEHMLVLHDDSDLELGAYKLSFDRSSGGHKGIASIINLLGTKKFWRGRIGVRRGGAGYREKAGVFVLKKITRDDKRLLEDAIMKLEKALYARNLLVPIER